jgi:hypothetical protein
LDRLKPRFFRWSSLCFSLLKDSSGSPGKWGPAAWWQRRLTFCPWHWCCQQIRGCPWQALSALSNICERGATILRIMTHIKMTRIKMTLSLMTFNTTIFSKVALNLMALSCQT